MNWINPVAELYAEKYTGEEQQILTSLRNYTNQQHSEPHMLSGHVQGKLLELISLLMQPQHVLEIGTMVGYSTICLAKGLRPGGKVHTLEKRKEDLDIATKYFREAKVDHLIEIHEGDAVTSLSKLNYTWDLVFLDADKTAYKTYYEMVIPHLRSGGLLIADNVLFHGEVLKENIKGKNALAVQEFNEHVKNDKRVEKLMLTVRDGVYLILKR